MKYFFTTAFVMMSLFTNAQIVNIPDSNFKQRLLHYYPVIDLNADGEIQITEALAITRLEIGDYPNEPIRDITGIREFKNLDTLFISSESLEILDLSGLNKLLYFWGATDSIAPNCFSGCSNLKEMRISMGNVENFNPGVLDSLEYIEIFRGEIGNIDMRDCKSLTTFFASPFFQTPFHVRSIYLDNLDSLKEFRFTALYWTPPQVIDSISLSGCKNLHIMGDLTHDLRYLNLDGCNQLAFLTVRESRLSNLDLSTCYNLQMCWIQNGAIMTFNCKNGHEDDFHTLWMEPGSHICADDIEIPAIRYFAYEGGFFSSSITSYCTFFPGGPKNIISGITRLDVTNNGCDNTDRLMSGVPVKITDADNNQQVNYSTSNGIYTHYAGSGSFTLTPYFPYPYFAIAPSVVNVQFDTANNLTATRDFCIQPNGTHNDLEISFLPTWPVARPGFNATYTLLYKNRGTTTLSGNVTVNFDNSKMNFVAASENVSSQSTGQIVWNYNNLQPFESKTINVTFNLLPPPVNNIGDTVSYLAVITPSDNDETAFDNIFILPQRVIGSFDPNEKKCLEGSNLDISKIGDYLHYMIHFQNEGTDTAFNIVVADTLSDKLDWNSFEFIGSSHKAEVRITNNKAEFFFENINLPYKAIDEPASNGWVAFKIKPKPSVVIGDSLNNKAAIYFDFNLPVITNTATTIVSSASTPVPVKLEYFSVSQKNNTNLLNWKASCTYGNATFIIERSTDAIHFASIGNIHAAAVRCRLPFNFTDNNPAAGKNYYRLKITDADGKSFYSKTLVAGNSKAGLEITAVANNTIYLHSNKQQTITLKILATDGREMINQKQTIITGNNNISVQMKNTAKGIYTLIIYSEEGEMITKRFIQ